LIDCNVEIGAMSRPGTRRTAGSDAAGRHWHRVCAVHHASTNLNANCGKLADLMQQVWLSFRAKFG
jgi:hypothetical protein